MIREREVLLMAGLSGVGKTWQFLKILNAYLHGKGLIFDWQKEIKYDQFARIPVNKIRKQKSGIYKVQTLEWQDVIVQVSKYFRDGVVAFDDAGGYLPKMEYTPMLNILIGKRHYHLDVILMFQSLNRVPPYVLENSTKLMLFKTNDNIKGSVIEKIPRPDLVTQAFRRVEASPDPHYFEIIDLKAVVVTNS